MVAMAKRVKTFQIIFSDPCKTFYCGGDKVSGRVEVEVNEVMRVSAVKVRALGCAKVEYAKGKQRCRQEAEYLRYEEVLRLDEQPTGTDLYFLFTLCCHRATQPTLLTPQHDCGTFLSVASVNWQSVITLGLVFRLNEGQFEWFTEYHVGDGLAGAALSPCFSPDHLSACVHMISQTVINVV